jgi:hypothetical protein
MTISNRAGHRKVPGPVCFVDEERAMKKVPATNGTKIAASPFAATASHASTSMQA